MNDKSITSLKKFYIKRFKAIFPMFYISFSVFFIRNAINAKALFYRTDCSPWTLIFSVIGMDGYFRYAFVNYYILGEWFLGAIIIAYLVYPLLLKGIEKIPLITTTILTLLFAFMLINHKLGQPVAITIEPTTPLLATLQSILNIDTFRNPISCIFAFYVGMLFFKYKQVLESNLALFIALGITVVVAFIPFNISQTLSQHIMGYSLFIVLYHMGTILCKNKLLEQLSLFFGKISYPIFLLQAVFVQEMLAIQNPIHGKQMLLWMFITILFISACATLLQFVTKLIMKPFKSK